MSTKFQSTFTSEEPKRYVYEAIQQTLTTDELGTYVTYGIRASSEETQLAFVSDVSTDESAVRHLAERCTEQQLDPVHLENVIEDFLEEVAMV